MTETTTYSIGELAEIASVTPRTIRYYTSEGLLPQPETQGKYARYSEDHRNRLELIAHLKDAYLPLHEIRQRTAHLDAAQVIAMLQDVAPAPVEEAQPSSAEDYISEVLSRQQTVRTIAPPAPALKAETASPPMMAAPAPMPAAAPAPQTAQARGGFFKRLLPQRQSEAAAEARPGETWQRITLAPGIELHTREGLDATKNERVRQLINHARTIFGNED